MNRLSLKKKIHFSKAFVLYTFSDKIMQIVHLYKYNGKKSLGLRIGDEAGKFISTIPLLRKADMLVPVPLHRVRRRERGYNQSEIIARRAAAATGIPVSAECLRRIVDNPSQTGLSLEERHENVKGIFKVTAPEEVVGKTLILIDDVMTTGVTMNECARVFREAGAADIVTLAVIHPGSTI
jgi:ComF family protein